MKKKLLAILLSVVVLLSTIGGVALAQQSADDQVFSGSSYNDPGKNKNNDRDIEDDEQDDQDDEDQKQYKAKGELNLKAAITSATADNITIAGIVIWITPRTHVKGTLAAGTFVKLEATFTGDKWVGKNIKVYKTPATPTPPTTAPATPTNVTAAIASDNHINLGWTDVSNNETGFRIRRATDAGFTTGLVTVNVVANLTSYHDATVLPGTTYYYRVQSYNAIGDSPVSNTASATTPAAATTAPIAASNLTATAASQTLINLAWTDNSNNETGFRVERATNIGFTTDLVNFTVGADVTVYADNSVVANTTYFYRVVVFNAIGDGIDSNTATVTTPAAPVSINAAAVFASNCASCHGANHPASSKTVAQLVTFISSHNTGSTLTADQVAALASWIDTTAP